METVERLKILEQKLMSASAHIALCEGVMHRTIAKLGLKVLDFKDNAIGCLRAYCDTGDQSYIEQPPPVEKTKPRF